jgi:hypothetical protein
MDYGAQEIIVHFLKRTTSVSFVQVLTVTEDGTHRFGPDHLKIVEQTYLRSPSDLPQVLQHSLRALPDMLARPELPQLMRVLANTMAILFMEDSCCQVPASKSQLESVLEVLARRVPPNNAS